LGRKARGQRHDAVWELVGGRIRQRRQARGLTLKKLGSACALSHPFLSQVERGLARPSVETLAAIADALDTTVAALTAPTPRANVSFIPREGGRRAPADGEPRPNGAWVVRETVDNTSLIEAFELTFEAETWHSEVMSHEGEEFIYMISGRLEIDVDGSTYVLRPGDALAFDGTQPHRYRYAEPGRALQVVVRAGGQAHNRSLESILEQRIARRGEPHDLPDRLSASE
jgi:transcriptional regulator with XRE-family HTH domain